MPSDLSSFRPSVFIRISIAGMFLIPAFFLFNIASAQTASDLPGGATQEQVDAALGDLSDVYGQPVENVRQAKSICNLERFMADCAEIGKRHDLYEPDEVKQVDIVLNELKGKVIEDLKQCADEGCLVDVAGRLAKRLADKNPRLARDIELTPKKVKEKEDIVTAAKEIGVSFSDCRAMDPDTASVELLRACARLAKDERVQKYLPEEARKAVEQQDATTGLQTSLLRGEYQCGDDTLEGCGNFCLNSSPEARRTGISAIPAVCRQIAERFFGQDGIRQLESAYIQVRQAANYYERRADLVVFTTHDDRTLTDPAAIGRYMESEAKKGNVEAIERGTDFMLSRGFIKPEDKEFALGMVRKIQEGGGELDFDECEANPQACEYWIPEEHRAEFAVMKEVEKIMTEETQRQGISDPSRCEFDLAIGEACVRAAQTALPRLEALEDQFPAAWEVSRFIDEIDERIKHSQEGFDARQRVEEKFRIGEQPSIGDKTFSNFSEMDAFCRGNASICLAEAAKKGFISRDSAEKKYERTFETQFRGEVSPGVPRGPYPGFVSPGRVDIPPGQIPDFTAPGPGFGLPAGLDKEEALRQFKAWLDNPQGQPPVPVYPTVSPRTSISPETPFYSQDIYRQPVCPAYYPAPCPDPLNQYREFRFDSRTGCDVPGECVYVRGYQPKPAPPPSISGRQRLFEECVRSGKSFIECERNLSSANCASFIDSASCEVNETCYWAETQCRYEFCPVSAAPPPFCQPGQSPYDARGCNVCQTVGPPRPEPEKCPLMPTVESCPSGQRKEVAFSSPECGTYYKCVPGDSLSGDVPAEVAKILPGARKVYDQFGEKTYLGSNNDSYVIYNGNVNKITGQGKCSDPNPPLGCPGVTPGISCGRYTNQDRCYYAGCDWSGTSCVTPKTIQPVPGSAQCSDGRDNDGDGLIDYPADTGCYGRDDNDETTGGPVGGGCLSYSSQTSCQSAGCTWYANHYDGTHCDDQAHGQTTGGGAAACSDGRDNDGDGLIDYPADTGCYSRDDSTEDMPPSTGGTTCPSGQYWSGTACVSSTSDTCSSIGSGWHQEYTENGAAVCFNNAHDSYKVGTGSIQSCSTVQKSGCVGGTAPPGPSTTCDSSLIALLGAGCHQMYTDSSGNQIFCDTAMIKSAKRGDTVTTPGCASPSTGPALYEDTQILCSDGIDNDRDGFTDLADPGCSPFTNTTGGAAACSDGRDNDGDGLIDYPADTGCYSRDDSTEDMPPSTGGTTCPSGQYWSGTACVSSTSSGAACSDGRDNDGDGLVDYPSDTGCYGPDDSTEDMPPSTGGTTCPSGQYWNGTVCVTSTTSSGCTTPATCFDSAVCTSSGWYWYNGGCWSSPQTTSTCGNNICDSGETSASCPGDCPPPPPPAACGNAICESSETSSSCSSDCGPPPPVCGNAICESSETSSSCPSDCGPPPPPPAACGDNICNGSETSNSCPGDCPPPPPPPTSYRVMGCSRDKVWNGYHCVAYRQPSTALMAAVKSILKKPATMILELFSR